MTTMIDAKNVTVSYPDDDGDTQTILNNINLKISGGDLVTVVGPSGCGKSTLLSLVLGSAFPTLGTVQVADKTVERITRDCGIVYQSYSLLPHLTVLDNISLGPLLEDTSLWDVFGAMPVIAAEHITKSLLSPIQKRHNAALTRKGIAVQAPPRKVTSLPRPLANMFKYFKVKNEAREHASELLLSIGLTPKDGDKYPYELSGGMRQRVSIAQALIMKPKILLMDEPFGALDHGRREEMQDFIHDQWKQHKLTVMFVTHDLDEAIKLGTRLICLSQYWVDEKGNPGTGSKIVVDRKVMGGDEKPSTFVTRQEFRDMVIDIGHKVLDSRNLQRMDQFDLSHPDAFCPSPALPPAS
ncbi:MAG TPA: ATP-binding cassette domain-containing protein [Oculatellaceae cyanobacterium]